MRKYEWVRPFCARARYITNSAITAVALFAAQNQTLAMGQLISGQSQTIPTLIKALRDPQASVRFSAEQKLVKAGSQAVRDLLVEMSAQRQLMLLIFAQMGDAAIPRLLELMKEPELAHPASEALFQVIGQNSYRHSAALLDCMKAAATKHYCGTALVKAMGPKAKGQIAVLVAALKSPDQDIRAYAAGALGRIGPKAKVAIPALNEALKDQDSAVRWRAAEALKKIGGLNA